MPREVGELTIPTISHHSVSNPCRVKSSLLHLSLSKLNHWKADEILRMPGKAQTFDTEFPCPPPNDSLSDNGFDVLVQSQASLTIPSACTVLKHLLSKLKLKQLKQVQLFILGVTTVQLAWSELDLGTLQTLWWFMPEFCSLLSQFKAEICWWNIDITYLLQGHHKTSINFLEASVAITFTPPEWKVGCSINPAGAPVFQKPAGIWLAHPPEMLTTKLDSDCLETDSRARVMSKMCGYKQKEVILL